MYKREKNLFEDFDVNLANITKPNRIIGQSILRQDIKSVKSPFYTFPDYVSHYPCVVIEALKQLYIEYNDCFRLLVEANREWDSDYQYCEQDGRYLNRWVQIDMMGLPDDFLATAINFSVEEMKEILRFRIFEIENSLAMYQVLMEILPSHPFKNVFLASLDSLRAKFGKPIAILAVTDDKYQAVLEDEMGILSNDEKVSDSLVKELTGFDTIFNPKSFLEHVRQNNGECRYLLYVRSSDPVAKLKNPLVKVDQSLLSDPNVRVLIKANSLTLNINNPSEKNESKLINDTKAYMLPMNMGYVVRKKTDLFSLSYLKHLQASLPFDEFVGDILSCEFKTFLEQHNIDSALVIDGTLSIRLKPFQGTYGCYGHHVISVIGESKKRKNFYRDLRARSTYIAQIEMVMPKAVTSENQNFNFIDRVFFAWNEDGPEFMGGFRTLQSPDETEARKGRFHGSEFTYWASVVE